MEFAAEYLDTVRGVRSDDSVRILERRYRRIDRDLRAEYDSGRISTTSPKKMTVEDVRIHLQYRLSLGFTASEYKHELGAFISLFDYVGNPAVRSCIARYPVLRPVSSRDRLPVLTSSEYAAIRHSIGEAVESGDYRRIRSWALFSIILACGLRTKEVRLMPRTDVDVDQWLVTVRHPKGENTYGSLRVVPVHPEFRAVIAAYLDMRDARHGTAGCFLMPLTNTGRDHVTGNSLRDTLRLATLEAGIEADPHKLRRSFGQNLIDSGIDSIETVSVLMGHATTQTTEKYYARRRNDAAIQAAITLWNSAEGNEFKKKKDDGAGNGVRTHDLRISLEEV